MLRNDNNVNQSKRGRRSGRNYNYNSSTASATADREVEMLRAPLVHGSAGYAPTSASLGKKLASGDVDRQGSLNENAGVPLSPVVTQQEQYHKPPAHETDLEAFSKLRDSRFALRKAQREKEERDRELFVQRRRDSGNSLLPRHIADLAGHHSADFSDFSFASAESRKKFVLIDIIPSQAPNPNDPYIAAHFPMANKKMKEFIEKELPSHYKDATLSTIEGVSSVFQQLKRDFSTRFLKSEKDRNDLKPSLAEPLYWRRAHLAESDKARCEKALVLRQKYQDDCIPNLRRLHNFNSEVWSRRVAAGMAAINDEEMRVRARLQLQLNLLKADERRNSFLMGRRLNLMHVDVERKMKVEKILSERRALRAVKEGVHEALGTSGGVIDEYSLRPTKNDNTPIVHSPTILMSDLQRSVVEKTQARIYGNDGLQMKQHANGFFDKDAAHFAADRGSEEDEFHDWDLLSGANSKRASKNASITDGNIPSGLKAPPPSLAGSSFRSSINITSSDLLGRDVNAKKNRAPLKSSGGGGVAAQQQPSAADSNFTLHRTFSPENIKADVDGGHNKHKGSIVEVTTHHNQHQVSDDNVARSSATTGTTDVNDLISAAVATPPANNVHSHHGHGGKGNSSNKGKKQSKVFSRSACCAAPAASVDGTNSSASFSTGNVNEKSASPSNNNHNKW